MHNQYRLMLGNLGIKHPTYDNSFAQRNDPNTSCISPPSDTPTPAKNSPSPPMTSSATSYSHSLPTPHSPTAPTLRPPHIVHPPHFPPPASTSTSTPTARSPATISTPSATPAPPQSPAARFSVADVKRRDFGGGVRVELFEQDVSHGLGGGVLEWGMSGRGDELSGRTEKRVVR